MNRAQLTYYLIRRAEEMYGAPVCAGDWLTYRSHSRLPWIDPVFEIRPGRACRVLSVEYDPAIGWPDYDAEDNHYHYRVRPLEHHDTLVTTEIVALFDTRRVPCGFDDVCQQIAHAIQREGR